MEDLAIIEQELVDGTPTKSGDYVFNVALGGGSGSTPTDQPDPESTKDLTKWLIIVLAMLIIFLIGFSMYRRHLKKA